MVTLELKFSADQRHQLEAFEAITDLFRGQEFLKSRFAADAGRSGQPGFESLTVGNFATSSSIQMMVINIQAFNRDYAGDGNMESCLPCITELVATYPPTHNRGNGGREPWPPLATSPKRSFPVSVGSRSATSST